MYWNVDLLYRVFIYLLLNIIKSQDGKTGFIFSPTWSALHVLTERLELSFSDGRVLAEHNGISKPFCCFL